jgi:hypothetical protein
MQHSKCRRAPAFTLRKEVMSRDPLVMFCMAHGLALDRETYIARLSAVQA